jgi:hypothetical protein
MMPTNDPSEMDAGERAARHRLNTLFQAFDRLTPDELARIGYQLPPDDERDPLLDAVDEAAVRTGRVVLVGEARDAARDAVMNRYSAGSFRPTFVGLNWGISQGTIESRVAIAETLADAAAAAVVEDTLDPEIAAALALDAASITNLATGDVSEGSLARAMRLPGDADLRPGTQARRARSIAAVAMVALAAIVTGIGALGAAAVGVVAGVRAITRGPGRTP